MSPVRIGHGYDVHRLVPGRRLVIGGVEIEWEKGLLGHSDADVLLHALMDALLGAAALPDIGHQFPDSDPAYEGADSLLLLEKTMELVRQAGYALVNADCTVIAQRPKLAPHIGSMRRRISETLGTDIGQINIKATTEEGLGFTGEGAGIAAHAVVLIEKI